MVVLPINKNIVHYHKGKLPISLELISVAKTGTVLSHLWNSPLVSHAQLWDDDCEINLTSKDLAAANNNVVVLEDFRNPVDSLWDIPMTRTWGYKKVLQDQHTRLYGVCNKDVTTTITTTPKQSNISSRIQDIKPWHYDTLPSLSECNKIIQQQLLRDSQW